MPVTYTAAMALAVTVTLIALAALLVAEATGASAGVWIAKPVASTGFVAVGVAAGALDSTFGRLVLLALLLSWWGDVLLIPKSRAIFLAGLGSFLLGHVAYAAAFVVRGVALPWLVGAAAAMVAPALLALRWLAPHVPAPMRVPVRGYVTVISIMVACAVATVAHAGGAAILAGASMFYVSDLAVARHRFVAPGFANKVWGLPLYYGGQLLLAAAAGGA